MQQIIQPACMLHSKLLKSSVALKFWKSDRREGGGGKARGNKQAQTNTHPF